MNEMTKIMLQLFGEDGGAEDGNEASERNTDNNGVKNENNGAKYTDADVDRILNQKFAKWEANKQKEIDEAARLANMTSEEKRQAEMKTLQAKIAELEAKDNKAKMSEVARTMMSEADVSAPTEILNLLVADSAEATKTSVEAYINAFQSEVKKAVKAQLSGKSPSNSNGNPSALTKKDIMSIKDRTERQRLINENPKLFGI